MMHACLLVLAAGLLVGPTHARQGAIDPESTRPPSPTLPSADERSVLLTQDGSDVFATAPGWAAFLRPGEVRFAPATQGEGGGLGLTLESARRGGTAGLTPASPTPRVDGQRAVFTHRGFEEVYLARLDGLKQSFVFPTAPPGQGDLVVRLRLDLGAAESARLTPESIRPDGIVFARNGESVVRIGAVLGIDAAGREVTGELRLDGEQLDLVLPGEFVDTAAYPLELDPLIQPFALVPGTSGPDGRPDVAWEADSRRFCLTWTRNYGGTWAFVAQLFEEDGTPVWPMASLGWTSISPVPPAVCAVGRGDHARFVMAHGGRTGWPTKILVTSMRASDMQMHKLYYPVPLLVDLDMGGSSDDSMEACLVWSESFGIHAQRLRAPAPWLENERLVPHDEPFKLTPGPFEDHAWNVPRISQSNGEGGKWLAVWEHRIGFTHYPEAIAIGPAGPGLTLSLSEHGRTPSCDGDGEQFLIAYNVGPEILGALVRDQGTMLSLDLEEVLSSTGESLHAAQVAITPLLEDSNTFTVSWLRRDPGTPLLGTVRYRAFKSDGLEPFGPEQTLTSQVLHHRSASLFGASPGVPSGYSCLFDLVVEQSDGLRYGIVIP